MTGRPSSLRARVLHWLGAPEDESARIQALEQQLASEERTTERLNVAASLAKTLSKLERARTQASLDVGRLDYSAADIYLRIPTTATLGRLHSCRKEPWTVRWLEEWLEPDQTLYDIGANVGAYSLVAAKSNTSARVIAFEPGAATFAALCENIVLNEAEHSIVPLPIALARSTGVSGLRYSDREAGRALHSFSSYSLDEAPPGVQPVLSFALDDLISQFGLPAPNHMKIDVDGAEEEVLAGAERTLADPALSSVLIEVHPHEASRIDEALASAGLTAVGEFRAPPKQGREPSEYAYGLYAREGHRRLTAPTDPS